ncbi:MAG: hypothetical protein DRG63_13490 [Deltaproteobacteria bacterium]|nr:MAG: hypothetical protein DRG63_13490 [Deltaproteobacteria bacterium]
MKKDKKKGVYWWVLLLLIMAALLGYVLMKELGRESVSPPHKAPPTPQQESALPTKGSSAKVQPPPAVSKQGPAAPPHQPRPQPKAKVKIDYCAQLDKDVMDFLTYLDHKPYVQHLELGQSLYSYVKGIIRRLSAHPPVPAGEGIDPRIMTKNIYHLYRVLGRKDIRLIREVLHNEQDTLEINLDILYRWVMAGGRCKNRLGLRPSFDVLYKYAGFFLNTIGGRAYLWRRSDVTRILATYYCILVVHEADLRGQNSYGIDIYPIIISLKNEITHYHDLEFQAEYLNKLTSLETYYMEKR